MDSQKGRLARGAFCPGDPTGIIIGSLAPLEVFEEVSECCSARKVPINLSVATISHKHFQVNIGQLD